MQEQITLNQVRKLLALLRATPSGKVASMSAENTSAKFPDFNGKANMFAMFWAKFKAHAAVKGFLLAIQSMSRGALPAGKATAAALNLTDSNNAEAIAATNCNALAMASFWWC